MRGKRKCKVKHNFYKSINTLYEKREKKPLTKVPEGARVIFKHCGVMIEDG